MGYNGKNKGQFYLLGAIIIIVMIIGFAAISNYAQKRSGIRIYDLKEDLEIESAKVLDYGTYNEFNETQMEELLQGFLKNYIQYIAEESIEVYFIFGNYEEITVLNYQELGSEIIMENNKTFLISQGEVKSEKIYPGGEKRVIITIDGSDYEFKLRPGENFYFVLSQIVGEEQYIVTG